MTPRFIVSFLFVFIAFTPLANAQTAMPLHMQTAGSPWTIVLEGGYASGVSSSMRGTNAQFASDVEKDYNYSAYPFGDPNAWGAGGGARIEYRFLPGNFGAYAAGRLLSFTTSNATHDSATLAIGSISLGAEYIYDVSPSFDLFGKAGINGSLIGGQLVYTFGTANITTPNDRFGFELGLGADWNPWSIILLRAFVDYSNVNLIGKSYTPPDTSSPLGLFFPALNDGANPNNSNDRPRTIDYLLIGIGIGVRF
jgi:opacity protein-like surface antigen